MRRWYSLAVLFAVTAWAGEPKVKASWEWSTEERLAARFAHDSPAIRAASGNSVQPAGERYFEIDGKRNPELLLPFELFRSLVGSMSRERDFAEARLVFDRAITDAGWRPDDFWKDLKSIAASYVAAQAERLEEQRRLDRFEPVERRAAEARIERLSVLLCRTRAATLTAARERFGPAFDRFLYTAVAPTVNLTSAMPQPDDVDRLRALEGGCR